VYIAPSDKILRHPERLAALKRGEVFPPIGVEVDLTNRCNLGCTFCHFGYTHSRGPLAKKFDKDGLLEMGDQIDNVMLGRALIEMKDYGVESITFTGGGEPTLYPYFYDVTMFAKDIGFKLGLYTNATLITPELADVIKHNYEWVVVSMDYADRDEYNAVKQVPAFEDAKHGTRLLTGGDAKIGVSFLLDWKHNGQSTDEMQMLGRELGADYVEFRPKISYDLKNPSVPNEDTSWAQKGLRELKLISKLPDLEVRLASFEHYANWRREYSICRGILFTGIVTPNGKVWTCVNRRGFPDSEIGDLNKNSFSEVWANQKVFKVNDQCRVMCRADEINRTLDVLSSPVPHEEFV
jgi:cyclic pyranopterin phosphate synthase